MAAQSARDREQVIAQIVARCWSDPGFLAELRANPAAVARAAGLDVPDGTRVAVAVDTPEHVTIVIPRKPDDAAPAATARVIEPCTMCAAE